MPLALGPSQVQRIIGLVMDLWAVEIAAEKAHEGWLAVGFSEDRKMGDDAVIMDVTGGIYMSKYDPGDLLTRWNVDTPDEG